MSAEHRLEKLRHRMVPEVARNIPYAEAPLRLRRVRERIGTVKITGRMSPRPFTVLGENLLRGDFVGVQ